MLSERLLQHIRTPLYRNGYALALSSAASSALGMVFWLLAARLLPAEVVGIDSALIAASAFIGTVAQLNLTHALNRFLPRAGSAAGVLIVRSYAVSAGLAVIAGAIFLLGIDVWTPTLGFLRDDPVLAAWFVVGTSLSCIFVLQDGVLTGLRRAHWVPVENAVYGLAKLGLLAGLVMVGTQTPVFLAWTAPYLVVLLGISWLIFRRLVPEHGRPDGAAAPLNWAHIRRFVAGDYAAALVSTGVSSILPVLVLELTDPASSAYFSLAFSIAYTLFLFSRNMGMSLVAEAAHDESRLNEYSFGVAVQTARVLFLPVAALVLAAPLALGIFGSAYASNATTLLRLLAVSALPGIVTSLFVSKARVQRRMRALVAVMAALNGTVVGLSVVLVPRLGIDGVGVAWLVAHTVAAVVLLFTDLRGLWVPRLSPRLLRLTVRAVWLPKDRIKRRKAVANLVAALPSVRDLLNAPDRPRLGAIRATRNEVYVADLHFDSSPYIGVLKLAANAQGDEALGRQAHALVELHAERRITTWDVSVPRLLASGEHAGRRLVVEQHLTGTAAYDLIHQPRRREPTIAAALEAIGKLHSMTATEAKADAPLLDALVHRPLATVARSYGNDRPFEALELVRDELCASLTGRRKLWLGRIHGDLSPRNTLLDADGNSVCAMVDWEDTVAGSLPEIDCCHLLLAVQMECFDRELGDIVDELLASGCHPDAKGPAIVSLNQPNDLPPHAVVLLTWLHHVAAGIAKSSRSRRSVIWHDRNVTRVLLGVERRSSIMSAESAAEHAWR